MDEFRTQEHGTELCDNAHPAVRPNMCTHLCTALRTVFEEELSQHPVPKQQVELLLALRHKERDRTRRRSA